MHLHHARSASAEGARSASAEGGGGILRSSTKPPPYIPYNVSSVCLNYCVLRSSTSSLPHTLYIAPSVSPTLRASAEGDGCGFHPSKISTLDTDLFDNEREYFREYTAFFSKIVKRQNLFSFFQVLLIPRLILSVSVSSKLCRS